MAENQPEMEQSDTHPMRRSRSPFTINIQYIKELSFEVPEGPGIFLTMNERPSISVELDVDARQFDASASRYEVAVSVRVSALDQPASADVKAADGTDVPRQVFAAQVTYCGVVTLLDMSKPEIAPLLAIEVPHLMFPFVRDIIADVTRKAGFQPVMLEPIDFALLWEYRQAAERA